MDPYFCQLYVDTKQDRETLKKILTEFCKNEFDFIVDPIVYKNVDFNLSARQNVPYNFIECSNFRVELEMIDEIQKNISKFNEGIARIVVQLRELGCYVVSTEIESFLIEKTGWNWTEETPEPPGRILTD